MKHIFGYSVSSTVAYVFAVGRRKRGYAWLWAVQMRDFELGGGGYLIYQLTVLVTLIL